MSSLNDKSLEMIKTFNSLLVSPILPSNMVPISTADFIANDSTSKQNNRNQNNTKLNKNYSAKTDQAQSARNNNLTSETKKESGRKHSNSFSNSQCSNELSNRNDRKQNQYSNKSNMKTSYSVQNMQNIFDDYWTMDKVKSDSTIIQGKIRINPRSYEDAFISDPSGGGDIYVNGLKDRNRALNNDIVAVKLKEKFNWKVLESFRTEVINIINNFESKTVNANLNELFKQQLEKEGKTKLEKGALTDYAPLSYSKPELLNLLDDAWFQRTGFIVAIIEKKHNRLAAGHLKLFPDRSKEWVLFSPNDSRLPRIKVKLNECPTDFYTNSQFYANTLFIAQIKDIPINSRYAIGELKQAVGKDGDIAAETEAILIENGIDYTEFNQTIIDSLPQTPWKIPDSEYNYRRDLRNLCIFTIDPATARDLDDALHVTKISDDLYEVGVHIADVSYFVPEESPIDKCASERTTSVYLVQKVIPMLPRLLCEQLCSLNPALDRLTFSVIWKMKANGDVVDEWFGRTVINSAVKLSYEHAQKIIESPEKEFDAKEFPDIRSEFCLNDIKNCVLNLHTIAQQLRSKRFTNGSLALNQPKINFVLNKECGMPYGYNIYQQKESNKLVEEFMLLANIAVAHRIYKNFPEKAILRRHPAPNSKQIEDLEKSIKSHGYECDLRTSHSIQALLQSIKEGHIAATMTLTCLLTKTMQLAQYFCSGFNFTKEQFAHYALAVPLYTHFTSPIRRYPDVLVHRLLAASLGYCQPTERHPANLNFIADNCNDKKYAARVCSERSSEMFFSLFINECGPFEETGSVIQINDHSFDVLVVNLGIVKRVYCDKLAIVQESLSYQKSERPEISFIWQSTELTAEKVEQSIKLFSTVNVVLVKHDNDKLRFNMVLKHPKEVTLKPLSAKIINEVIVDEQFYNQQIDTDPYLLD